MLHAEMLKEQDVLDKLSAVRDPDLGRDIVSLGYAKNIRVCAPIVSCDIELTNLCRLVWNGAGGHGGPEVLCARPIRSLRVW